MISKTGRNAAQALTFLAKLPPQEYAGAARIAGEINAPRNYLGKLLKNLAGLGLVESQKGYGGGFRLARPAKSISLFDIIDPIDKVSRWGNCLLKGGRCSPESPCAVHDEWKKVRKAYLTFLENTSVADLATDRASLPK